MIHELTMRRLCRLVDGEPSGLFGDHLANCLRCQAEAVRYRFMLRALSARQHVVTPAPEGFEAVVQGHLGESRSALRDLRDLEKVAAGAAVALAGAMVLVQWWRHRVA